MSSYGFRPFDPVVDTETDLDAVPAMALPRFRPFDPVVDTETVRECTSTSQLVKGFRPFDPVVDTET